MIDSSRKFSMAISNAPGPIKPYKIVNDKGEESFVKWVGNYGLGGGCVGMLICGISNWKTFKISVTADEIVCPQTKFFVDKIYQNIMDEIERMKDIPVPEKLPKK